MRELLILNKNELSLKQEMQTLGMQRYKITSKTYGPFGPVTSFELFLLEKTHDEIVMDISIWRETPLYRAYERFAAFNPRQAEEMLDIAFALKALMKHPFAEFKVKAFRKLLQGEACAKNESVIRLKKSSVKALVSAIRPAVEYAYYYGDDAQKEFWEAIFAEPRTRYSEGMISQSFGHGDQYVKPCLERLKKALPKIKKIFYGAG